MSPEQAKGRPVDKRCDVWAFGCVVFEMLSAPTAAAEFRVVLNWFEELKARVPVK